MIGSNMLPYEIDNQEHVLVFVLFAHAVAVLVVVLLQLLLAVLNSQHCNNIGNSTNIRHEKGK